MNKFLSKNFVLDVLHYLLSNVYLWISYLCYHRRHGIRAPNVCEGIMCAYKWFWILQIFVWSTQTSLSFTVINQRFRVVRNNVIFYVKSARFQCNKLAWKCWRIIKMICFMRWAFRFDDNKAVFLFTKLKIAQYNYLVILCSVHK